MEEPLLTESECDVDVCVLGTGLVESLAAAALARHGRRVLHLDRAEGYGGALRALSLAELEAWGAAPGQAPAAAAAPADGPAGPGEATIPGLTEVQLEAEPPQSCFSHRQCAWDPFGRRSEEDLEALQADLRKRSNQFSIDVVPRLLFGRSDMVDVLVESGVARYLEFQGLNSARVLTPEGFLSVPLTKSEIFQDPALTLPEKRTLMRFITSMGPFVGSLAFASPAALGVDQARKVPAPNEASPAALDGIDMEEPWLKFLQRQKLSPRLQDFLTYAICLWDWAQRGGEGAAVGAELSTAGGLRCLGRFVSSLGMHGSRGSTMPLLYPMYGAAEVAQGFTRMCALHRGTYALRTSVRKLLASPADGGGGWCVAGLVTQRGEVIRCRAVVASHDQLRQRAASVEAPAAAEAAAAAAPAAVCRRLTVLLDRPLLVEEALTLCVVPPSAVEPPLGNVVQVLQLDWHTGSCPKGYYVVHLSQVAAAPAAAGPEGDGLFGDLDRVLARLLSQLGEEDGERHCLLRCAYLHAPREGSCAAAGPAGEVLRSCLEGRSLTLCSDPPAAPQLLLQEEVGEARSIFLAAPLPEGEGTAPEPADFLRKPAHVAEEEQGGALEALEAFNEDMQAAQRSSAAPPAAAAADAPPAAPVLPAAGAAAEAAAPAAAVPPAEAAAAAAAAEAPAAGAAGGVVVAVPGAAPAAAAAAGAAGGTAAGAA